jgi:hypothetical protein
MRSALTSTVTVAPSPTSAHRPWRRVWRSGEPARHARAVEEGQGVGQGEEVALLGQQEVGVPAVALPAEGRAPVATCS